MIIPELKDGDIRIIALGGVEEVGRNMTIVEYKDSIVIIDEAQNLGIHEMFTLITRIHESSKLFICGDLTQVDERDIKSKKNSSGLKMVLDDLRRPDDKIVADVEFFTSQRRGISRLAVERLSHMAQ